MQVAGLADVSQDLLQIGTGLVAVIEQQDATLRCLALDGEPVGYAVVQCVVAVWEHDTEVLDQHGGHVPFDHWHFQQCSSLVDNGRLTTARCPLDAHRTLDGEQLLDCLGQ